jgi:hypothetical protein
MQRPRQNPAVLDIAELHEELRHLAASVAALANLVGEGAQGSYTLKQFLARHNLSESQYHKLRRAKRGPRTMSTGEVSVRISRQSEADWVRERERDAAARADAPLTAAE